MEKELCMDQINTALKHYCLGTTIDSVNFFTPLVSAIEKTAECVVGKEVQTSVRGSYVQKELQNHYITFEFDSSITEATSIGLLVSLLNIEINSQIISKAAEYYTGILDTIRKEGLTGQCSVRAIEDIAIQSTGINMILGSVDTVRKYIDYCREQSINLSFMEIFGFKAISVQGIPLIADKFCDPDECLFIDTTKLKIHQLCDWRWLENEDEGILRKIGDKYKATLVKYDTLVCYKPVIRYIVGE